MGYCPQDRIEYEDEMEECVVCGGPLLEGSVEEMFDEVDPVLWVELDPLNELVHAVKVRDALDEAGIPCYISADLASGTEYYGGAVIFIQETQYDEALEIQQGIAPPDDDRMIFDPDADDEW